MITNNKKTDARQQIPLGLAERGYSGVIHHLAADEANSALSAIELESRLLELGFVEGARVEVLHEGIVGRDPIAVRIENVTIAVQSARGDGRHCRLTKRYARHGSPVIASSIGGHAQ